MTTTIKRERPDTPEAMALIEELETVLSADYKPEERYGYSVEKLIAQGVHFFVVRVDGTPVGCGGVQFFEATDNDVAFGELKRMYTRPAYRRQGLSRELIAHIEELARERGVPVLRLETGIHSKDAIGLYRSCGYQERGPFGEYGSSTVGAYYEKHL